MPEQLRVLGVFPHPDDEAYSCGGTMALLADAGALVQVLCATAGEGGRDRRGPETQPGMAGSVRREELEAACAALGIAPPQFLGLRDGHLDEVDFPGTVATLVQAIRTARPHIVVTLGSDGVYGHPDHLALYRLVVAAFASASGGARFSEARLGAAWQPRRLFAAAFPRGMFRPMYEHMLDSEYTSAIRGLDPEHLGVEPAEIAASVDIRAAAERKLGAISSHRSQLRGGDPLTLFPGDIVQRLLRVELFTLAAGEPVEQRLSNLAADLRL